VVDAVDGGRLVATLGPGEGFGEIALLRRMRRTATVVARSDLLLQALGSDRFLSVVLGYTPSARQAAEIVDERLDLFESEGSHEPREPKEPSGEPPAPS
jgi:CRP-like cAMP-binding protein